VSRYKLAVTGDGHGGAVVAAELDVAAPLTDLHEATPGERCDHLRAREQRQRRAMIGSSISSGSAASSK
jgi:hypothetical protein